MTGDAPRTERPGQGAPAAPRVRPWAAAAVAAIVLAVLLTVLASWFVTPRPPGDDSLEAGFARDMIVHHDQAVAMALLIRDRTEDPLVTSLATDIILTQQNQIGQMLGWLNLWRLPATGLDPPMTWMGDAPQASMADMATPANGMAGVNSTPGAMPGMASPAEIDLLTQLSGEAADAEFLRLMIRHHRGAIPMAEVALAGSEIPAVRDLARSIVVSQQAEIEVMDELLRQKGAG